MCINKTKWRGLLAALVLTASLTVGGVQGRSDSATSASAFRPRRQVPSLDVRADILAAPSSPKKILSTSSDDESSTNFSKKSPPGLLSFPRGGFAENTLLNAVLGSTVMALIEKAVKEVFKVANIKFPSQLGACLVLFAFLLLAELVNPKLANSVFGALSPGAALLAKWLPVFFVPGLAMLPLAPSVGDTSEVR